MCCFNELDCLPGRCPSLVGSRSRESIKMHSHGGETGEKRGGKSERRESRGRVFCLQMQPATASAQVPVNHHLAQTLLVAAYPGLADIDHPTAHYFTGFSQRGWHPNSPSYLVISCPYSCGLGVHWSWKFIFHFYHYWYLPPWDMSLSCWKKNLLSFSPSVFEDDCNQSMDGKYEWDSQWVHWGLGAGLGPPWVLLNLKSMPTELTGVRASASRVKKQRYCVHIQPTHSPMHAQHRGAHIYIN